MLLPAHSNSSRTVNRHGHLRYLFQNFLFLLRRPLKTSADEAEESDTDLSAKHPEPSPRSATEKDDDFEWVRPVPCVTRQRSGVTNVWSLYMKSTLSSKEKVNPLSTDNGINSETIVVDDNDVDAEAMVVDDNVDIVLVEQ